MKVILVLCCLLSSLFLFASQIPLTLTEQIQISKLIVVGSVVEQSCYYQGKAKFISTKYIIDIDEVLLGEWSSKQIEITAAGGTINGKTDAIADNPILNVGDKGVFMLYDPANRYFSPFVGQFQGLYKFVQKKDGSGIVVVNGLKEPAYTDNNKQIGERDFVQKLRNLIPAAKLLPLPTFMTEDISANLARNIPQKVYAPTDRSILTGGLRQPDGDTQTPVTPDYSNRNGTRIGWRHNWDEDDGRVGFNVLPDGGYISGIDQQMMAYWNEYSDLFRRYVTATGTWEWDDYINDIAGFVDNAHMDEQFGRVWGPTELAVCFMTWNIAGHLNETDIAINAGRTFSTDSYGVYGDGGPYPIQQTMLHEVGHAWGEDHNWSVLSVINYYEKKFRSYWNLYAYDAIAIRSAYAPFNRNRTDILVAGYHESFNSEQSFVDALLTPENGTVAQADTLYPWAFYIENTGTVTANAIVQFYLCPTILSFENSIFVREVDFGILDGGQRYYVEQFLSRELAIPLDTPVGDYYIGMLVATPGDEIWQNDESWIDRVVHVTAAPPPPPAGVWVGSISRDWFTAGNWSNNSVPIDTTDVTIPSGVNSTRYPDISGNIALCRNITIEFPSELSITSLGLEVNGNLSCSGVVTIGASGAMGIDGNAYWQSYSTLNISNYGTAIAIKGNWTVQSSTSQNMVGTVAFIGDTHSQIYNYSNSGNFRNLLINKTNQHAVFFSGSSTKPLSITGDMTLSGASQFLLNSNQELRLYGNLTGNLNSYFVAYQGTVRMLGSNLQTINLQNFSSHLYNLIINNSGTGYVALDCFIKLYGSLTIDSGYLTVGSNHIYLKGNWTNNVGTTGFYEGTGRIMLNGDGLQNIGTEYFNILELNKPMGEMLVQTGSDVNVASYDWTQGALRVSGGNLNIVDVVDWGLMGDVKLESGMVEITNDVGQFDLLGNLTIEGGTMIIHATSSMSMPYDRNCSLTMSGGVLDLRDGGLLVMNSTSFTLGFNITGGTIRTTGNVDVYNSRFSPAGGTIEMYGSGDSQIQFSADAVGYPVYNLLINKDATGSVTAISSLILLGNFNLQSGTFVAPSTEMLVYGNWNNAVGPAAFVEGSGLVTFAGSSFSYCSTETFNNLTNITGTGAIRLSGGTVICNNYNWESGAIDVLSGTFTANELEDNGIFGDYYVNPGGVINLHQDISSYIDLRGNVIILGGEFNVYGGSGDSYWCYEGPAGFAMNGGMLKFFDHGIYLYDNPAYTLTSLVTGGSICVPDNFTNYRTDFSATNWTLWMFGAADGIIATVPGAPLHHVLIWKDISRIEGPATRINRSGEREQITRNAGVNGSTDLVINGNFVMMAGTFTAPALITVYGNWAILPVFANFVPGGGTVTFLGNFISDISWSCTFNNLSVNKAYNSNHGVDIITDQIVTVLGNMTIYDGTVFMHNNSQLNVAGNLTIAEAAGLNPLEATNPVVRVGGHLTDNNTFLSATEGFSPFYASVVFNGNADQNWTTSCSSPIYSKNLTIDKPSGAFMPNHNLLVDEEFVLKSGAFSYQTAGLIHTFRGNFTVNENGSWLDHTCLITFAGSNAQQINISAPFSQCWFDDIYISKPAVRDGLRTNVITLGTDIRQLNAASLAIVSGELQLNGHTWETNGSVDVQFGGKLTLNANSTLRVDDSLRVMNGGYLSLLGSEGQPATITHYSTDYYSLMLQFGSNFKADYAVFEYMNGNGVYIQDGTYIDPDYAFNHSVFQNGISGGALLRLDNSQTLTNHAIEFPTNTWSGTTNVWKTIGDGSITFQNATGGFAGPAFENDPFNRINWSGFLPDLQITRFSWSDPTPDVGDTISCTATIRNSGSVAATGGFWVDLFYNRQTAPGFGNTADQSYYVSQIAVGDTLEIAFSGITSEVSGDWQSWLFADASQVITEISENNNIGGPYSITWQAVALPNLTLTVNPWTDINPYVGDLGEITISVTNNSTVDITSAFNADLYFNSTGLPDGSAPGDLSHEFASLSAGQTVEWTFINITSGVAETWNSFVLLDRLNNITEVNEEDNSAQPAQSVIWRGLPAITNLSIRYDQITGKIVLEWDYPIAVSRFNVFYDTDPMGFFSSLAGSNSGEHNFSHTPTEVQTFYKIKAERDIPAR